ncbi:hypothetical protein PIB30_089532, partial [Stylosanthes scabra]|nr:hypothetical protein [Stylosanthes scabra]
TTPYRPTESGSCPLELGRATGRKDQRPPAQNPPRSLGRPSTSSYDESREAYWLPPPRAG